MDQQRPPDPEREPAAKSKRLMPAIATAGGVALAAFELRRLGQSGGEAWFWLLVAALMIVLGLVGLFQPPPPRPKG